MDSTSLNVAYVVTRAEPLGGVQVHVRDLAAALGARGHNAIVLSGGTGAFTEQLQAHGIRTIVIPHLTVPIHPVHDLLALREISGVLRGLAPDVVALHSAKAGILGRLAAHRLRIPAILTAHGWTFTPGIPSLHAMMYRQIERFVGRYTDTIITVSEFDRQLALEAGIVAEERLITVYNGVPDVSPDLRAHPGRDPVRLIMVARFAPQKDHVTLLRALAGLQDHAWELDLVGEGPLLSQTKALAATLGVAGRIRFLGQRTDVHQLLAQAQIALLVSNWEGFPISIIEAMRAGLPVIATSIAGVAESVRDDATGYLVPRGGVDVLRERIAALLKNAQLRARLGENGRRFYEQHFTLDTMVERTLAVYRSVLGARARPISVSDHEGRLAMRGSDADLPNPLRVRG